MISIGGFESFPFVLRLVKLIIFIDTLNLACFAGGKVQLLFHRKMYGKTSGFGRERSINVQIIPSQSLLSGFVFWFLLKSSAENQQNYKNTQYFVQRNLGKQFFGGLNGEKCPRKAVRDQENVDKS